MLLVRLMRRGRQTLGGGGGSMVVKNKGSLVLSLFNGGCVTGTETGQLGRKMVGWAPRLDH